ncbi:MAG: regulatory iron-sulfur-containing complex subunit RicT [Thermodesulfobacteriota bacterium]
MSQQEKKKPARKGSKSAPRWYYVQFRQAEQIHAAGARIQNLQRDEQVMVATDHGLEPARITSIGPQPILTGDLAGIQPAFAIHRRCSRDEQAKYSRLLQREEGAFAYCLQRIAAHKLAMKLIKVERFFNGSKIIFYFTADNRVDFRGLVKDLVQEFRTRVEMRQVGVRHETKMTGGIGSCGRQLCCSSFINNFAPVSIKMAKEQHLPLNPTKISGICNRLLCCLTYEFPTYRAIRREMPRCGKTIKVDGKSWKVIKQNILSESLTVVDPQDRDTLRDMPRKEWQNASHQKSSRPPRSRQQAAQKAKGKKK